MTAHVRLGSFLKATDAGQAGLAERLGRDRSYVSHLIAGRIRPSLEIAVAIERLTAGWAHGPIRPDEWLRPAEATAVAAAPAPTEGTASDRGPTAIEPADEAA